MGADRRWAFVQPVWLGKVTRIFWLFALGVFADIPLGSTFGGFSPFCLVVVAPCTLLQDKHSTSAVRRCPKSSS